MRDKIGNRWKDLIGEVKSTQKLTGGINSSVYLCRTDRSDYVIKGYADFASGAGCEKRMQSETDFLSYANRVAPGYSPRLVATDWENKYIVLEYIRGSTFRSEETICMESYKCAREFLRALNVNCQKQDVELDMAVEGYRSLRQHMQNVCSRVESMDVSHMPIRVQRHCSEAIRMIRKRVSYEELRLQDALDGGKIEDEMRLEDLIISPGDFGFHNALKLGSKVVFIDFEYAGWDDPAKCIVDFAIHPGNGFKDESSSLIDYLEMSGSVSLRKRIECLYPVLALKWASIILGFLNKEKHDRMVVLTGELSERFVMQRIRRAMRYCTITDSHKWYWGVED